MHAIAEASSLDVLWFEEVDNSEFIWGTLR
jgi:hypothetical protein